MGIRGHGDLDGRRPTTVMDAALALERGEIVALPTETVYGLACDAANIEAVEALFALKGRPADVPLPVAVTSAEQATSWLARPDTRLQALAQRWWPGPLTVVATACEGISERITAGLGTVGLRVPDQPQCVAVLQRFGRAVVLTSANRHGAPPARSAEAVRSAFPEGLASVVDGGPCTIGTPSTIVALLDDGGWRVLRDGAVGHAELASVLDP